MSKNYISILLPAYNEESSFDLLEQCMTKVLEENPNYDWEFLMVNDGSQDNTLQQMIRLHNQDPQHYNYLSLSRNFGKEAAVMAGLDYVKGDAVIIMDIDMQDPVEVIPEMIKYWEEGFDDVYAQRQSSQELWLKKNTSKLYYRMLQRLTKVPIQIDTGDFRLLDRSCIEAMKHLRETQRNNKGLFSWIGFKKKGILYERKGRQIGKSKWSFMQLLDLAINGFSSYTVAPLRISTILGFFVSLVAFLYLIFVLVHTLIWGDPVAGYPTIMVTMLFLGGVQLLSLGIIGEYLGKIFMESKNRPNYFVESYNGEKESELTKYSEK